MHAEDWGDVLDLCVLYLVTSLPLSGKVQAELLL